MQTVSGQDVWTKCLGAGCVDQVFRAVLRGRMCGLSV